MLNTVYEHLTKCKLDVAAQEDLEFGLYFYNLAAHELMAQQTMACVFWEYEFWAGRYNRVSI